MCVYNIQDLSGPPVVTTELVGFPGFTGGGWRGGQRTVADRANLPDSPQGTSCWERTVLVTLTSRRFRRIQLLHGSGRKV